MGQIRRGRTSLCLNSSSEKFSLCNWRARSRYSGSTREVLGTAGPAVARCRLKLCIREALRSVIRVEVGESKRKSRIREAIVKRLLIFGLLCSVSVFSSPKLVGALAAPGPTISGICVVLDSTCAAVDSSFVPTFVSAKLSRNVVTVVCQGTTSNKPTKTTICDGEKLGGPNGETAPLQPCSGTLFSGLPLAALKSSLSDDWSEVISKTGSVKLTCTIGGKDTK